MDAGPGDAERAAGLHLVLLALVAESVLAALGLVAVWWRTGRISVPLGDARPSILAGGGAALVFAAGLHVVLRHPPDVWVVRGLRRTYRDVLRPIFGSSGVVDLIVISAAAGIDEELLFRAGLQPVLGLVATSVVFGVVHVFSRDSISIGLWALMAGLVFGWLMNVTGGLTAPVLAHATYDGLALAYIRWGPADF